MSEITGLSIGRGPEFRPKGPESPTGGSGDYEKEISIVKGARNGEERALNELYGYVEKIVKSKLMERYAGNYFRTQGIMHDKIHDVFVIVLEAIREGKIRQPERLAGYIARVAWCQAFSEKDLKLQREIPLELEEDEGGYKKKKPLVSKAPNLDELLYEEQRRGILRKLLQDLKPLPRQIIERFYFEEQAPEQIQEALNLSPDQFRLLKSRAIDTLAELLHTKKLKDITTVQIRKGDKKIRARVKSPRGSQISFKKKPGHEQATA